MRDFKDLVRRHIEALDISHDREVKLVEEISSQLEEFYDALVEEGYSEHAAWDATGEQLPAVATLRDEALASDPFILALVHPDRGPFAGEGKRAWVARGRRFLETAESHTPERGALVLNLIQDAYLGARMLWKRPGFAVVATLSLAIGIAVNTMVFSLIDGTLMSELQYPESSRMVRLASIQENEPGNFYTSSILEYLTWLDETGSFDALGGMISGIQPQNVGSGEDGSPPARIMTHSLTHTMWDVFGIEPILGRVYTAEEDQIGGPPEVIVISYDYWQRRYAGDPEVIGQTLLLENVPTTILGVMPPEFDVEFYGPADAWTPPGWVATNIESTIRYVDVVARLAPGVTIEQAQAEMDSVAAGFAELYPDRNTGWGVQVRDLQADVVEFVRTPLLTFQGAVAFVLLIACANVAGMLMASASSRQSEVALRTALGAGRWRIARQMLGESAPLAALGAVVGVGLAWMGLKLFLAISPFPEFAGSTIDGSVLLFTTGITLASLVVFGVVPAVEGSRADLASVISEGGRSGMGSAIRQRFRSGLAAVQIALALVLLVGAGLMINSFIRVRANQLGVNTADRLMFQYQFSVEETMTPVGQYAGVGLWDVTPELQVRQERLLDRLREVPGVLSVGGISRMPFTEGTFEMPFRIDGDAVDQNGPPLSAGYFGVTPGFFETMDIPIVAGRAFESTDRQSAIPVVIVNETMADAFWPGASPLGRTITLDFVPNEGPRQIVGVVGDVKLDRLQQSAMPLMYVPYTQHTTQWQGPNWYDRLSMTYIARTAGSPMGLEREIQSAAAEADPTRPVAGFATVDQVLGDQVGTVRAQMILLGVFGAVAALLAAVGIYGVMAYSVVQRTREIGVRMALGAPVSSVVGLVLAQGMAILAAGLILGLAGSVALTRLIEYALWGVTPTDPMTFAAVSIVIVLVALAASVVPARRAMAVDPMTALRSE